MEIMCKVLLYIAYGIEPAALFTIFDKVFERRQGIKNCNVTACWLVCYILLCLKQVLSGSYPAIELILFIAVILFYVYSTSKLYKNNVFRLMLLVGLLCILALVSECVTFGILSIMGFSIEQFKMVSVPGVLITYISKGIYLVLCYFVYRGKNKKTVVSLMEMVEVLPLILGVIVFEAPTIILFNNMKLLTYNDTALILFSSGQIGILFFIVYLMNLLRKHRMIEHEYIIRSEKDAAKLESYAEINKIIEELREMRHDFRLHITTLKQLYGEKKYKEIGDYIDELGCNLQQAEKYIILENEMVAGLLNQKAKEMLEKNIDFKHVINISDFKIKDNEVCSLLGNILDNAIDAAEKAEIKKVSLAISYETTGYMIMCKNTYAEKPVFKKGTYVTKKIGEHGLGIRIIRKIAQRYGGMAKFEVVDSMFVVSVFIPYMDSTGEVII